MWETGKKIKTWLRDKYDISNNSEWKKDIYNITW